MKFLNIFQKDGSLVGIDIGAGGVKLLEIEGAGEQRRLVNLAYAPFDEDVFSNNLIAKPEKVADVVTALFESNGIGDSRIVASMPGPSVFTKKIKMAKMPFSELSENIQYEAGNFIPHNIDAVKLDFHVIGESGKNQLDVLVVAVKKEIINSFIDCFALAGLDVAIVDVDYFAMQNMFETNYPEHLDKTVALVNIGQRFSSINICARGHSLFTGDVTVGGRLISEAIAKELAVPLQKAEALKLNGKTGDGGAVVQELVDRNVEYMAMELNRQLSFFWNAAGAEQGIDTVMLGGGSAQLPGLADELSEKTGIPCALLDPFRKIAHGGSLDQDFVRKLAPVMSICVGLGLRKPNDKVWPELE